MSGPFTLQCVENTLHGPIFCSPLPVSIQTQQPGMPDKLCVCWHLSKGDKNTPSMNSHIQKEDFPTQFNTASRVANIVGYFLTSWQFFFFIHICGPHLLVICLSRTLLLAVLFLMGFTPSGPIFTDSHLVVLHISCFCGSHISWSHILAVSTSCGSAFAGSTFSWSYFHGLISGGSFLWVSHRVTRHILFISMWEFGVVIISFLFPSIM